MKTYKVRNRKTNAVLGTYNSLIEANTAVIKHYAF